jgi:hypothetical protein
MLDPSCSARIRFAKLLDPGSNKTSFPIGVGPRRYQHFNQQHLVGARLGQRGIVQINPEVAWSQRKETLEKIVLWIPSSNACRMDSPGKAVFLVG